MKWAFTTGIITSNHNIYNLKERDKCRNVEIGESCWIGMNIVILPGVVLGNHTKETVKS